MAHVTLRGALVLAVATLAGCADLSKVFEATGVNVECTAALDDSRSIRLMQRHHRDALRTGPDNNYAELLLEIWQGDALLRQERIARLEGSFRDGPVFSNLKVEARADATNRHVWFVDKNGAGLLGTLDLESGVVTGMKDSMPPWVSTTQWRTLTATTSGQGPPSAPSSDPAHDANEPPPVFDRRPFAEAKKAAEDGKKWFIVKATATWCMPCKRMDRTTWRDKDVVEWLANNAVAVALDVDEGKQLAVSLRIEAMPTIIAFRDGREFDRVVGYQAAGEFLSWLQGIARGQRSSK